jgi:hypothetical protein
LDNVLAKHLDENRYVALVDITEEKGGRLLGKARIVKEEQYFVVGKHRFYTIHYRKVNSFLPFL